MDIIGKRLHVRKPCIRVDPALSVAWLTAERWIRRPGLNGPTIIYVDILVSVIDQSTDHHRICSCTNDLIAHMILPDVPTVPAHVRSQGESLAAHNFEFSTGCA